MEKSEFLIISVLAILKANMISVPLDIHAPDIHLEHIIELCRCRIILTVSDSAHCAIKLAQIIQVDTVVAGQETQRLSQDNLDNNLSTSENQVCHILFTSGSTGMSKGVKITHHAVAHNTLVFSQILALDESTRSLQFAAPTFAVFVLDVFQTLFSGGCLVMATREAIMADITTFIRDSKITFCWLTPTVSRFIDPARVPSLRILLSSGENLPAQVAEKWKRQRSCTLWNSLGSTEALAYTMQNLTNSPASSSHVGQAIPGMKVVILESESDKEVAEGERGEICVAGPQLLHGYLSKNNAHSRDTYIGGIRFFRTGDFGIFDRLACGRLSIRCIGRGDSQVKINGVRLDLGDVEMSISACALVKQAVVLIPQAGVVSGQIIAIIIANYISHNSNLAIQSSQVSNLIAVSESSSQLLSQLNRIKDHARKTLSANAIPRHWWIMETLPLLTSGKIDRFKIRTWLETMDRSEYLIHIKSWTNTENLFGVEALEMKMKILWADILDLPEPIIQYDVSFFEFGADSLTVTRLVARARDIGLTFTYEQVFTHKTIRQLVKSMINSSQRKDQLSTVTSLSKGCQERIIPKSSTHSQSLASFSLLGTDDVSTILSSQNDIEDIVPASELQMDYLFETRKFGHPILVWFFINLDKQSSISQLLDACKIVSKKHSILRTEFQLVGKKCYQVIMKRNIDFKIRSYSGGYADVCSLIDREMAAPVTFGKGLVRFRLFISETGTQHLGVGLCHSLFDGFSMPLIYHDLEAAYFGTLKNLLAPPYSLYIRHIIEISRRSDTNMFWAETLRDSQMTYLFKRRLESSSRGMMHLTRVISYDWKRHGGMSLAIVLKAAFALTLYKLSSSSDITYGSVASGRSASIETAMEIVGPLINFVPARFQIENEMTFYELLQKVLEQQVAMIPYESTPMAQISKLAGWDSVLFGSTLIVQNLPTQGDFTHWKLAGIASYDFDRHFNEFALLVFPRSDGVLTFQLDYKLDLSLSVCNSILDLLVIILEAINNDPNDKVNTIRHDPITKETLQNQLESSNDMEWKIPKYDQIPTNCIEIMILLRTLWTDILLGVKDFHPDRSFFDLGGDSMMAVHLATKCEKSGLDLNLSDLIHCPTLNMQCLRLLGHDVGLNRKTARLTFWPTE